MIYVLKMKTAGCRFAGVVICALCVALVCVNSACGKESQTRGKYDISIELSDGRLNGCSVYTLGNADEGDDAAFCFYPEVLCDDAKIDKVCINGEDVTESGFGRFGNDDEFLLVRRKNFVAGDKIEIEYSFTLKKCFGRLGVTDKTINLAAFYPMKCVRSDDEEGFIAHPYSDFGDPFFLDFADYCVTVNLPSVFVIAGSAEITACNPQGNNTVYEFAGKSLRNFALTASELYNVVTKKSGNRSIIYYFYDDAKPEETLAAVCFATDYLSSAIGNYAYNRLTFAQSPYETGGMEYSGFFVLGESENRRDYLLAAMHETAHQWFPIAVGSDEYLRGSFDEGLAEFLTRDLVARRDEDLSKKLRKQAVESYVGYKSNCMLAGRKPVETPRLPLDGYLSAYEYVSNAYCASSVAFEDACAVVGEKTFYKALKKFYKKYVFKNASADDFFNCFSLFKRKKAEDILKNYV